MMYLQSLVNTDLMKRFSRAGITFLYSVLTVRHLAKSDLSCVSKHPGNMHSDNHSLPIVPGGQGLYHISGIQISICHIVGPQ